MKKLVVEAARVASMTFTKVKSWKFIGYHGGVSVIVLVHRVFETP